MSPPPSVVSLIYDRVLFELTDTRLEIWSVVSRRPLAALLALLDKVSTPP